jgi:hypothetical protein
MGIILTMITKIKPLFLCVFVLGLLVPGCMEKRASEPVSSRPAGPIKPVNYDILQEVITKYTSEGQVKYKSLKENPGRLEEFLASVTWVGPKSTPQYFCNSLQNLAFWINLYNAACLRAGAQRYPGKSVQPFWGNFEDTVKVQVDGREMALSEIAKLARLAGQNDPRIDLALILPAKGSGQFPQEVYRPEKVDQQLTEGVGRAMKDPKLVQFDHMHWTLGLGSPIYRNRVNFIKNYEKKFQTENATILSSLGVYADPTGRSRLNSALGYHVREIPFDWSLNVFDEPPCSLDNYK